MSATPSEVARRLARSNPGRSSTFFNRSSLAIFALGSSSLRASLSALLLLALSARSTALLVIAFMSPLVSLLAELPSAILGTVFFFRAPALEPFFIIFLAVAFLEFVFLGPDFLLGGCLEDVLAFLA